MLRLTISDSFAASHQLEHYDGDCNKLHGHTWRVAVVFRFSGKLTNGIAVDFKLLKGWLRSELDALDHTHLNTSLAAHEAPCTDPTAEVLAQRIFFHLEAMAKSIDKFRVDSVEVWESDRASVRFSQEANI